MGAMHELLPGWFACPEHAEKGWLCLASAGWNGQRQAGVLLLRSL